ncbi:hypothetical protein H072_2809 [Dactylellina haptotyla CBS 200.50]|uniref:Endonuclease III homolog n=1 Tax=Dactylellina haptotyla (strain CBS 200.50) TaxID=1284197 RepID=S8AQ44_DACHA|nr:hypothetical protein H072_2809 [Dactylellina haptotyla CBS 200.50]
MRSAKTQVARKIRSFANIANAAPTTRATRAGAAVTTTTTTTTIVSKLPKKPRGKSTTTKKEAEEAELSEDSELSSAPSDLESDYSESAKLASSDDGEEYTASPYFASEPPKKRKKGIKSEDKNAETRLESALSNPKSKSTPKRTPAKGAKIKKTHGKHVEIRYDPPSNWREMYDAIKEMRLRIPAAVDTMGCARLAQEDVPPKVKRFQHLIALMMSSQTKDEVTSDAMKRLQTELPGGLTIESILEVEPTKLNELIGKVGFHNKKTEYIKKAAIVLRDKYGGDIPEAVEDMIALDGVGPKMSYLLEQCAWNKASGIGVDVHVHRIANMFKWVPQSSEPETTRMYLQSWLPKDLWREINWLLVGFGQSVCLPRGRRCDICTLGPKSTGGNGMCKTAIVVKNKTTTQKNVKEIKAEEGEGEIMIKKEEVVEEEEAAFEITDPLGIDENLGVKIERQIKKEVKEELDTIPNDIPDIEEAIGRAKRNIKRKR